MRHENENERTKLAVIFLRKLLSHFFDLVLIQISFDYYFEFEISEQLLEAVFVFTCSMAVRHVFVFKLKVVYYNAVSLGSLVDFIAVQLRWTLRIEYSACQLGINSLQAPHAHPSCCK